MSHRHQRTRRRLCCDSVAGAHSPHMEGCRHYTRTPPADDRHTLAEALDRVGLSKYTRRVVFEELAWDLPDGAYLALAEEFGLNINELVDFAPARSERGKPRGEEVADASDQ